LSLNTVIVVEMNEDELKDYLRAGEIAYNAKEFAKSYVSPGKKLLDVAEKIEGFIISSGGNLAFPVNLSINDVAAHRTPLFDDAEIIPENSVIKVDLGVHINGYIADTALTLIFNDRYVKAGEAVKKALEKGLREVRPGVKFSDIGRVVEKVIRRSGYKVIRNLTGHNLGRYLIHAGESIPNYRDPFNRGRFRSGRAYAMEPFGTDGKGWVKEISSFAQIYSLRRNVGERADLSDIEEDVLEFVKNNFKTLPFCERWLKPLIGKHGIEGVRSALDGLVKKAIFYKYPVLVEAGKGYVIQFEETFIVTEEGPLITTNPPLNEKIKTFKKV